MAAIRPALLFALLLGPRASVALLARTPRDAGVARGNAVTSAYQWPSGRGHVGHYSASRNAAPINLTASLSWTWHDPRGRYWNSPVGVVLDDQQNIFLSSLDGVRKFTKEGSLLWSHYREEGEELPDTAALYDGAVYYGTTAGRVVALSMETGKSLWSAQLPATDGTNGWVSAFDGLVLVSADVRQELDGKFLADWRSDGVAVALNATDGRVVWRFQPRAPLWNFLALSAGDGTLVFQDFEGRVYRLRSSDGQQLWASGGLKGSWTDGSALLGENGVVYAVNTRKLGLGSAHSPGDVSAYRLDDGQLLWTTEVPRVPNNAPALGRLAGSDRLALVQPVGQQVGQGFPTDVYALDAETGEVLWVFNGPVQKDTLQAGDANPEARAQRKAAGVREITLPNPWSAPSIDARGTVYIGSEEGPVYSLRDEDNSGMVEGENEVSVLDTGACFSGSSSPAIGDGMLAVASIDALYVFRD